MLLNIETKEYIYVCVCVCERERERERESGVRFENKSSFLFQRILIHIRGAQ